MSESTSKQGDILVEMRDVRIDGFSDDRWHEIIKGVDLTLRRGEVLGLIGESGAGKSTLGLAAMGFARPGCKISSGSIKFDGMELTNAPADELGNSEYSWLASEVLNALGGRTVGVSVGQGARQEFGGARRRVMLRKRATNEIPDCASMSVP